MEPAVGDGMGRLARARILADYAWTVRFSRLDELIAHGETTRPVPASVGASSRLATAGVR
jgi:hypothetical protein